jgi:hypothetical protein
MSKGLWYEHSYRRFLLDFHIDDWNKAFLSKFDPEEYAACVAEAHGSAATVFANTHTGLCNYPTRVGRMHAQFEERDVLGEMIAALHRRGISAIVYYCTIYVGWYWDQHPEARVVDAEGNRRKLGINCTGTPRRFGLCCPNNPGYRDFIVAQLTEICDAYDFEGVWPDMTMWPTVCYCPSCQERYRQETGQEIPRVIHWEDPAWVRFQRTRERWLYEFCQLVTSTIKGHKAAATVAHQSQTYCWDWLFAPSAQLVETTDWISADLYGDRYGLSYSGKVFHGLSPRMPFERINCWNYPGIHEHVITQSEDYLRANTFSTFMNGGAMTFIDQIDPVGTVHTRNYQTVGRIFRELEPYESYGGGRFCQDVALYYSFNANVDLAENGRPAIRAGYSFGPGRERPGPTAHRNAAHNLAKTLIQNHIPFGVVSSRDLHRLSDYQVVLLPHVPMLDDEEVAALRDFVAGGGSLYASKNTSLINADGVRRADFALSDVLGVSYVGETPEQITYVAPKPEWDEQFSTFTADWPVTLHDSQLKVRTNSAAAQVLATITLPWAYPSEDRCAALLTDPPGVPTLDPAVVLHRFGKGRALYAAGVLETWGHESQRRVLAALIRLLAARPFHWETDAHPCVEFTLFDQPDQRRLIMHVLNFQQELPNVPLHDLNLRIRLDGRAPKRLVVLPSEEALPFSQVEGFVQLVIPRLDNYLMLMLEYGER